MLFLAYLLAKIRIVSVSRIEMNGIRSVIELMDHRPWYIGKIQLLTLFPAFALYRIESVGFKLCRCTKKMRVGSHVEQPLPVAHRPDFLLLPI